MRSRRAAIEAPVSPVGLGDLSDGQEEVAQKMLDLGDADSIEEGSDRNPYDDYPRTRASFQKATKAWSYETAKRTGTYCPHGCFTPQVYCPSGVTCKNGHGEGFPSDIKHVPAFARFAAGVDEKPKPRDYLVPKSHCSDCGKPQFRVETGIVTCENKHDDATSLEETRALPTQTQASSAPILEPKPNPTPTAQPRQRQRTKKEQPPMLEDSKVRHVSTTTRSLIVLHDVEKIAMMPDVDGSIVKVKPTLKVTERQTFDAASLRRSLRERGAAAVIFDPQYVADGKAAEAKRVDATAEERVRSWFESVKSISAQERADAIERVTNLLHDAGVR